MSHKAVEVAITTRTPSHASRLVLICLAHHHNHLTGKCCPSYERIAEEMGLAKSSVTRAIKELVDGGFIEKRKGRRAGTHEGPNHYRLLFFIQARLESDKAKRLRYGDVHVPTMRPEPGTTPSSPILSEEGARPKRKRSQRRAIKTRMTEDWSPTAKNRAYAAERGFTEAETDTMAEKFKYWWIGDGGVKARWDAVWYTWVTNEKTRKDQADGGSRNSGARPGPASRGDDLERLHLAVMAQAEERRRREGGD